MKKKAFFLANTGFALFNFRLALMKYIADSGWSVIAVAQDEADFSLRFARQGIQFINLAIDHKGKDPLSDLHLILRLFSLYKKHNPDLAHHFTIKPVIFGSIAAKLARVPTVVNSITGLGYVFRKGGLLAHLVSRLYKLALSSKVKVTFQNTDDYNLFLSKGIVKKENAHVILGSGVNTNIILPVPARNDRQNLRFSLVSRMLWSKGIAEYISAAEHIKNRFPETEFSMVGGASGGGAPGNPEAISDKWLRAVNARGCVKWMGRMPFERVMDLLDESDVVVLPSYYPEGVPKSLIEAAAKGKPIITTDTPGCKEVVADSINGFLIQPRDVSSLTNAMLRFINEPQLISQMGAESRKRAVSLFDERKVLEQTAQVYKAAGAL